VNYEERFTRIENTLVSLTETQVRQQLNIEKQNDGIKDLIVLNRSLLESQINTTEQIGRLTEDVRQLTVDQGDLRQMVQALIETVERFIKSLQHPNGN